MAVFGLTPRISSPPNRTSPASVGIRPAMMLRSVDFPQPMNPTIETNSPRSTDNVTSSSTHRAARSVVNVFEAENASMYAMLRSSQSRFRQPHQSIEREPDETDRDDRQQDVGVDQAVVFLPQEAADARRPGQHLARDDDEPRDAEAQAISREDVRQRRRHDDLRERGESRQAQDLGDVPIVLRNGPHTGGAVDDRRPHRADRDGEHRGRLGFAKNDEPQRQPGQG